MILSVISDLAKENNVVIELVIGPDKAMTIIVYGKIKEWLIIGADWEHSTIVNAVKDTISRANVVPEIKNVKITGAALMQDGSIEMEGILDD